MSHQVRGSFENKLIPPSLYQSEEPLHEQGRNISKRNSIHQTLQQPNSIQGTSSKVRNVVQSQITGSRDHENLTHSQLVKVTSTSGNQGSAHPEQISFNDMTQNASYAGGKNAHKKFHLEEDRGSMRTQFEQSRSQHRPDGTPIEARTVPHQVKQQASKSQIPIEISKRSLSPEHSIRESSQNIHYHPNYVNESEYNDGKILMGQNSGFRISKLTENMKKSAMGRSSGGENDSPPQPSPIKPILEAKHYSQHNQAKAGATGKNSKRGENFVLKLQFQDPTTNQLQDISSPNRDLEVKSDKLLTGHTVTVEQQKSIEVIASKTSHHHAGAGINQDIQSSTFDAAKDFSQSPMLSVPGQDDITQSGDATVKNITQVALSAAGSTPLQDFQKPQISKKDRELSQLLSSYNAHLENLDNLAAYHLTQEQQDQLKQSYLEHGEKTTLSTFTVQKLKLMNKNNLTQREIQYKNKWKGASKSKSNIPADKWKMAGKFTAQDTVNQTRSSITSTSQVRSQNVAGEAPRQHQLLLLGTMNNLPFGPAQGKLSGLQSMQQYAKMHSPLQPQIIYSGGPQMSGGEPTNISTAQTFKAGEKASSNVSPLPDKNQDQLISIKNLINQTKQEPRLAMSQQNARLLDQGLHQAVDTFGDLGGREDGHLDGLKEQTMTSIRLAEKPDNMKRHMLASQNETHLLHQPYSHFPKLVQARNKSMLHPKGAVSPQDLEHHSANQKAILQRVVQQPAITNLSQRKIDVNPIAVDESIKNQLITPQYEKRQLGDGGRLGFGGASSSEVGGMIKPATLGRLNQTQIRPRNIQTNEGTRAEKYRGGLHRRRNNYRLANNTTKNKPSFDVYHSHERMNAHRNRFIFDRFELLSETGAVQKSEETMSKMIDKIKLSQNVISEPEKTTQTSVQKATRAAAGVVAKVIKQPEVLVTGASPKFRDTQVLRFSESQSFDNHSSILKPSKTAVIPESPIGSNVNPSSFSGEHSFKVVPSDEYEQREEAIRRKSIAAELFSDTVLLLKRDNANQKVSSFAYGSKYHKPAALQKQGPPDYFRKEIKNPQHKAEAKYKNENDQLKDIFTRKQKSQVQNSYLRHQQMVNEQNFVEESLIDDSVSRDRASSLLMNPTQPARIICRNPADPHKHAYFYTQSSLMRGSQESKEDAKKITNPSISAHSLVDKKTGIKVNPISHTLIDLEDLIYNKQFHKAALNTEQLQEQLRKVRKRILGKHKRVATETGIELGTKNIEDQQMIILDDSPGIPQGFLQEQSLGVPNLGTAAAGAPSELAAKEVFLPNQNVMQRIIEERLEPVQLQYEFKKDIYENAHSKKSKLLQRHVKPSTGKDEQPIESGQASPGIKKSLTKPSINDFMRRTTRRKTIYIPDQQVSEEEHSSSSSSEFSSDTRSQLRQEYRAKMETQKWKPENDDMFSVEQYLINVKTKKFTQELQKIGPQLAYKQSPKRKQNLEEYMEEIDEMIKLRKGTPQNDDGPLTSGHIRKEAGNLYKMIKGLDSIPMWDADFAHFIVNTFRNFSEDPLENENVICPIKNMLQMVRETRDTGEQFDKLRIFGTPEEPITCSHTHEDDIELQKRYKLQLWFIEFYKYLWYRLINSSMPKEEKTKPKEPESVSISDRQKQTKLEQDQAKLLKISKSIKSQSLKKMLKPQSKRVKAQQNLLRNLAEFAQDFPPDVKTKLKDQLQVKKLLEDPILKMMAIQEAKNLSEIQIEMTDKMGSESLIFFDKSTTLFINSIAGRVLRKFKDEIVLVKKKKLVTFKNISEPEQACHTMFNQDEQQKIIRKMMFNESVSASLTSPRLREYSVGSPVDAMRMQENDSMAEEAASPGVSRRYDGEASMTEMSPSPYQRPDSEIPDEQSGDQGAASESTCVVTPADIVKAAVVILNDQDNARLVHKYENDYSNKLNFAIQTQFSNFKKTFAKKQEKSMSRKEKIEAAENDELGKVHPKDLAKSINYEVMMGMYNIMKQHSHPETDLILNQPTQLINQFYERAKQMVNGAQGSFEGRDIDYFDYMQKQKILPVPIIFKNLRNNEIFLQRMQISMEQAVAIKNTLAAAIKAPNLLSYKQNPFIIKTLIIDDCGMTDEIFEQILLGINEQNHIKHIHYINNNFLGHKSGKVLKEICKRCDSSGNQLLELNLSNCKIGKPEHSDELGLLVQITQEIETVAKILRLKLSHLDLNDPELIKNIIDILQSNYNINYLNLAHSNIQLKDMIKITSEVAKSIKMEYLSLAGNKITYNGLVPCDDSRRPRKPETTVELHSQMVDEMVENLAEVLTNSTTSLRFYDISDLGLTGKHFRKIVQALEKNTQLESINFGHIDNQDDLRFLQKRLRLTTKPKNPHLTLDDLSSPNRFEGPEKEDLGTPIEVPGNTEVKETPRVTKKFTSKFTTRNPTPRTPTPDKSVEKKPDPNMNGVEQKEFYINSGMVSNFTYEKQKKESMLMTQNNSLIVMPQAQVILNRQVRNPELFNNKVFDAQKKAFQTADFLRYMRWYPTKSCFYCNRHRYVHIYFNSKEPQRNKDFIRVEEQEANRIRRIVRRKLQIQEQTAPIKFSSKVSPLLIINGDVYEMTNPVIYAGLVSIKAIMKELENQKLKFKNLANIIELAQPFYDSKHHAARLKTQEKVIEVAQTVREGDLRKLIVDMANCDNMDLLCRMTEQQIEVLKQFHCMNWDRFIEANFMKKHGKYITVINKQDVMPNQALMTSLDKLATQKKITKKRSTIDERSGLTGDMSSLTEGITTEFFSSLQYAQEEDEDNDTGQSSLEKNKTIEPPEEGLKFSPRKVGITKKLEIKPQRNLDPKASDNVSNRGGRRTVVNSKDHGLSQLFSSPVYFLAQYLPPGKHTMYVVDRSNGNVFMKEVLIYMAGGYSKGSHIRQEQNQIFQTLGFNSSQQEGCMEGPKFEFRPSNLKEDRLQEIDDFYEEYERVQEEIRLEEEKRKQAELEKELAKASPSKKKKGGKSPSKKKK